MQGGIRFFGVREPSPPRRVEGPKGGGFEGGGPKSPDPKGGGPNREKSGPEGWEPEGCALFPFSPANFILSSPSGGARHPLALRLDCEGAGFPSSIERILFLLLQIANTKCSCGQAKAEDASDRKTMVLCGQVSRRALRAAYKPPGFHKIIPGNHSLESRPQLHEKTPRERRKDRPFAAGEGKKRNCGAVRRRRVPAERGQRREWSKQAGGQAGGAGRSKNRLHATKKKTVSNSSRRESPARDFSTPKKKGFGRFPTPKKSAATSQKPSQ